MPKRQKRRSSSFLPENASRSSLCTISLPLDVLGYILDNFLPIPTIGRFCLADKSRMKTWRYRTHLTIDAKTPLSILEDTSSLVNLKTMIIDSGIDISYDTSPIIQLLMRQKRVENLTIYARCGTVLRLGDGSDQFLSSCRDGFFGSSKPTRQRTAILKRCGLKLKSLQIVYEEETMKQFATKFVVPLIARHCVALEKLSLRLGVLNPINPSHLGPLVHKLESLSTLIRRDALQELKEFTNLKNLEVGIVDLSGDLHQLHFNHEETNDAEKWLMQIVSFMSAFPTGLKTKFFLKAHQKTPQTILHVLFWRLDSPAPSQLLASLLSLGSTAKECFSDPLSITSLPLHGLDSQRIEKFESLSRLVINTLSKEDFLSTQPPLFICKLARRLFLSGPASNDARLHLLDAIVPSVLEFSFEHAQQLQMTQNEIYHLFHDRHDDGSSFLHWILQCQSTRPHVRLSNFILQHQDCGFFSIDYINWSGETIFQHSHADGVSKTLLTSLVQEKHWTFEQLRQLRLSPSSLKEIIFLDLQEAALVADYSLKLLFMDEHRDSHASSSARLLMLLLRSPTSLENLGLEGFDLICEVISTNASAPQLSAAMQHLKASVQFGRATAASVDALSFSTRLETSIPNGFWKKVVFHAHTGQEFINAVTASTFSAQRRAIYSFLKYGVQSGTYGCCLLAILALNVADSIPALLQTNLVWPLVLRCLEFTAPSTPCRSILHEIIKRECAPLLSAILDAASSEELHAALTQMDVDGETALDALKNNSKSLGIKVEILNKLGFSP